MNKVSMAARRAVNLTATGTIAGPCQMVGFYVNSTAGGNFTIKDGATTITGTITPAIGWHFFPYEFNTSAVFTIASTINMTVLVA